MPASSTKNRGRVSSVTSRRPITPLSPPVSATHCVAVAQTTCASARLNIARYTPPLRTTAAPNTAATASARPQPVASAVGSVASHNVCASAAP